MHLYGEGGEVVTYMYTQAFPLQNVHEYGVIVLINDLINPLKALKLLGET
jgi:hypothetical protein